MKEFVEKLIERLEKEYEYQLKKADECEKKEAFEMISVSKSRRKNAQCFDAAIQVVKQLAEEYKTTYIEELIKAKRFCANDCNTDKCPFGLGEGKCFLDELQDKLETKEQHNEQDLMIVASLPSLYPMMQPFEVEAIDRVVSSANHSGGWIPCSEKLPEKRDWYLAVFKENDSDFVLVPRVADYIGKETVCTTNEGWLIVDLEDEIGINAYYKNLVCIAWKPLPAPYQPKGE